MQKHIYILATGGTIAGVGEAGATEGYASGVLPVEALLSGLPRLPRMAEVTGEQYASLNSDDITQAIWLDMARRLDSLALSDRYDGFVITHGTDTLEESAYFFHLALRTDKPVVITGAMRPATATSADGPLNLYQAVALAASEEARGHGVLVVFNEGIYSARDVRKGNTFRTHAITGGDMGSLGLMRDEHPVFYHASLKRHTARTCFDLSGVESLPTVAIAYFHVDAQPDILTQLARTTGWWWRAPATASSACAGKRGCASCARRASPLCAPRASRTARCSATRACRTTTWAPLPPTRFLRKRRAFC